MPLPSVDEMPGFRRRFRITPCPGKVTCELEDDYHRMALTVYHDGVVATAVEPSIHRAPWTTCPGAEAQLRETFAGVALDAFAARGEKRANCTHLHDLALLAAQHASDDAPVVYDVLVSDPLDGRRRAEVRRNNTTILSWVEAGFKLVEPAELAGMSLGAMQAWIDSLEPRQQEAARMLRWGNMMANGRTIPLEQQSDASKMPPGCYTFQPQRAVHARRVGVTRDFSTSGMQPLAEPEAVL